MRFLHTADWHLGKSFFEKSLVEDQAFFLEQLKTELKNNYDALIVSGDIYDRSVPPSDAVTLLGSFLSQIHGTFPELHIFLLAGNHDSAERLSFAKEILGESNIHLCTDCRAFTEPVIIGDTAVYQLPFLTAGCICKTNSDEILRSQQDLLSAAVTEIESFHKKKYPSLNSVLSAHLFAAGGLRSDSERIPVGTADQVDAALLDFFDYTALGHLHSFQKAGKSAWYSGSPLSYSFDEAGSAKFMLDVKLEKHCASINKIPVKPLHRCSVIKGTFAELKNASSFSEYEDDYVQAVCTDLSFVANPMAVLRKRYENILSFGYERKNSNNTRSDSIQKRRELLDASSSVESYSKVFEAFLDDLYGPGCICSDSSFSKEVEEFKKACDELNKLGE